MYLGRSKTSFLFLKDLARELTGERKIKRANCLLAVLKLSKTNDKTNSYNSLLLPNRSEPLLHRLRRHLHAVGGSKPAFPRMILCGIELQQSKSLPQARNIPTKFEKKIVKSLESLYGILPAVRYKGSG
jgi:hypothetical protein